MFARIIPLLLVAAPLWGEKLVIDLTEDKVYTHDLFPFVVACDATTIEYTSSTNNAVVMKPGATFNMAASGGPQKEIIFSGNALFVQNEGAGLTSSGAQLIFNDDARYWVGERP